MKHTKKVIAGITATVLAVGLGTQATIVAQAAETTTYKTIPTNPNIAAQKTEQGKVISELLIDGDEIYTGYGDYNANTGPISVTSTNLKTNKITDYVSYPTEMLQNYKRINGKIYTTDTDPTVPWTNNVGYATNASGKWTINNVTPFIHVFDITSSDGKDLWLSGSALKDPKNTKSVVATLKRSVDGGKTWTIAKEESSTPTPQEMDRFYWVESVGGKVYANSSATINNSWSPISVWKDGTWSTVENPYNLPGPSSHHTTEPFKDKLVYSVGGYVASVDSKTDIATYTQQHIGGVKDFYVEKDTIYALTLTGIWSSKDALNWSRITPTLPVNSQLASIAVDETNKKIYIGGGKGQLYVTDLKTVEIFPAKIEGASDLTITAGENNFDILAGVKATDGLDGDITSKVTTDPGAFDKDVPGTYEVYYFVQNSSKMDTVVKRTITVLKGTKPTLPKFRKTITQSLVLEGNQIDPKYGIFAGDSIDGDITSRIVITGNVDTSKPGKQSLTYTVTNSNKLTASTTHDFLVLKKAPTINGVKDITIDKDAKFDAKAGITVTDTFAGDLVTTFEGDITKNLVVTGTVDTTKPGKYTLTYSATNMISETTTVKRIVTVKETAPATIAGADNITIIVNKTFDPKKGVTVKDKTDGDITSKLTVTGTVDTNTLGTYKLTYKAVNSNGITAIVERIVTVAPNNAPVFKENTPTTLERNAAYNAQTAVTVSDPDGDNITHFTYTTNVNTAVAGTYTTTYIVTDTAGQSATKTYQITVK